MEQKEKLTKEKLIEEARSFCREENELRCSLSLNDSKSIGTFIEHSFKNYLRAKYIFLEGNSALGVDFPDACINTDIKSTSIAKPQSSCPYKSPRQKIYGLGYSLLIFIYEKSGALSETKLKFTDVLFIDETRTGDYMTTKLLNDMLDQGCSKNDIMSLLKAREIADDFETLNMLSDLIITNRPAQGYLTISDALQLRLKYTKISELKENTDGVTKIRI
ncbi:MAG: hypothetical protein LUD22_02315 [Coprobacillus sp.]|nr:hypothetical protein [Coprobacillus sp.]